MPSRPTYRQYEQRMSSDVERVQLWSVGQQDLEDVPGTPLVVTATTYFDVRPHTRQPHTTYL